MIRWVSTRREAIQALNDAIAEVASDVQQLKSKEAQRERQLRELLTEWNSTYEKFQTLWARLRRRAQKAAEEPPQDAIEPEVRVNPLAIRLMQRRG